MPNQIPVTIVKQSPLEGRRLQRIPMGGGVVVHAPTGKVVEVHKLNPTTGLNEIVFQDPDYKILKESQ